MPSSGSADPIAPPTIRRADASDAAALAVLRYQFRGEITPAAEEEAAFLARCAAWMSHRLQAAGTWRCWVADAGDALIGTVWLELVEKLPNPVGEPEWHGYVTSLYVKAEHRGAGVGSALLEACLRECEARAVDAIILWPTPASRTLYLRHGFTVRDDSLERRQWTPPDHRGAT